MVEVLAPCIKLEKTVFTYGAAAALPLSTCAKRAPSVNV